MEKHILVIDNDEYNLTKIGEYLNELGFETSLEKSGQTGLIFLRRHIPDLIIIKNELRDIDGVSFIERKDKMFTDSNIPAIILTSNQNKAQVSRLLKLNNTFCILSNAPLENIKKKIEEVLKIPRKTVDKHLISEIFIRDGIIVCEIGGTLVHHELISLKYRILDTAKLNHTIKKRFFIIIYSLEENSLNQISFDKIFDFYLFLPNLPKQNIKILTSNENVKALIKNSKIASNLEVFDSYIDGINKLKSLYLTKGENGILVEFIKSNTILYRDVYDNKGNLIKKKGNSFNQNEINDLLKRGVKKLFYMRKIRVEEDKQIVRDEDIDVVMDAINISGVMVPEEIKDINADRESKKQFSKNILIVNSDPYETDILFNFFHDKDFPVKKTKSAKEAFELIDENIFDFLIVDTELVDYDGLAFINTLNEKKTFKDTNFIITAKRVTKEMVKEAIKLKVKGILKNPFNLKILSKIIK